MEKSTTAKRATTVDIDIAKKVFVRPESRVSLCFTGATMT